MANCWYWIVSSFRNFIFDVNPLDSRGYFMYNGVCCSVFCGLRPFPWPWPSLLSSSSHPYAFRFAPVFVLSNLAASSCTSSSHLIFYLPMGLFAPRLSSRICFWVSFVEPPYYIPSLNWYLFDPIVLLLIRNVVNGTEQNNWATERNSISQIITAWGFCLGIVLSPVFRFGKGRWCSHWANELKTKGIENTQLLLLINCTIFNFSDILRPAL